MLYAMLFWLNAAEYTIKQYNKIHNILAKVVTTFNLLLHVFS